MWGGGTGMDTGAEEKKQVTWGVARGLLQAFQQRSLSVNDRLYTSKRHLTKGFWVLSTSLILH